MRVTRLNVAGEIAVAVAVLAVLAYEVIYASVAGRGLAVLALAAGIALCRLTIRRLTQHAEELGRVQLAVALSIGAAFALGDQLPRIVFLLLCAFAAGYLGTALAGLASALRAQRSA